MTRTPLILLTGFLGAGKTTTVNRVLAAPHAPRIAVLVNDLGQVNIDRSLIKSADGDIVELTGGCVCCKIDLQRDLFTSIGDLLDRARPEYVLLETTGVAEPAALLSALESATEAQRIECTGVIAVVDAAAFAGSAAKHAEVKEQIACADRLLLTKLDLVGEDALADLHLRLSRMNPIAERASFPPGEASAAALVDWLIQPRRCDELSQPRSHSHHHGQLEAVTFVEGRPLLEGETVKYLGELAQHLVRAKGPVALAGRAQRRFFEKAGAETTWRDDPSDVAQGTELVLIGEALDENEIRRHLWSFAVG